MTSEYAYNANLPFIKQGCKGNLLKKGRFVNQIRRVPPGVDTIFKWQIAGNKQRNEKRTENFKLKYFEDKEIFNTQKNVIVWLGHASFFIRLDGVSILTDPCLGNVALLKRLVKAPCQYKDIQNVDYILLSHGHRDHLDVPSLRKIIPNNPKAQFLVPLKIGPIIPLGKKYKNPIQEAAWYQQYAIPKTQNLQITFLPAIHWNKRGLLDYNHNLWGSFLLQTPNKTIYFAGDTAYGPHFTEIKQLYPKIDICLMPIGAYKPREVMKSSHVSPHEAAEAFNELGAKTFIPMHYGTYDLSDEPTGEPIKVMHEIVAQGLLNGELKDLGVGERFYY